MKTLGIIKNNNGIKLGIINSNLLRLGEGEGDDVEKVAVENFKNSDEFKSLISENVSAAVKEATSGLSSKNQELLDDLKKAQGNLKQFEGMDVEQIKSMMSQINQSEEMKLIAEGKFDEVLQKRMDTVTAEHGEKVSSLEKALEESQNNANKYKTTLEKNTISDSVRAEALKAGVLPEALDDIIRRGLDIFSIDDSGKIEARDSNGQLLQVDDLLVTPERFVESLKKTSKHYWGTSQGAGAEGNRGDGNKGSGAGDGSSLEDVVSSEGNFDLEAYRKKRRAISGENYNAKR
jgi:hypothetical protein